MGCRLHHGDGDIAHASFPLSAILSSFRISYCSSVKSTSLPHSSTKRFDRRGNSSIRHSPSNQPRWFTPQSMFLLLIVVICVAALQFNEAFEQMAAVAPHVDKFSDLDIESLKRHGMAKVREDKSIIISELLIEVLSQENFEQAVAFETQIDKSSPSWLRFVQTAFNASEVVLEETEWRAMDGCIDNRFSDTTTTISRAIEGRVLNSFGPSLTLSLIGVDLGINPRVSSAHSLKQKIVCDVEPGRIMQLFRRENRVYLRNVRQRQFLVASIWRRPFRHFNTGRWRTLDTTSFVNSSTTACVTNPRIIRCQ